MGDKLRDILDAIPDTKPETANTLSDQRKSVMAGKDMRSVLIGSVNGKQIPAKFDPQTRIFYPLFKD